jgi:assimilatory nitrate reductase catalytic subunit
MTRTGLAPALMSHTPEPAISLNPADAATAGVADGSLARLRTDHGEIVLRAELRHTLRRGEAFAPMHWTDQFTSSGPVDRVVTARVDPVSGQPELKATPARVEPVAATFYGLLLRHRDGAPVATDFPELHWVRIPVNEGHLYRLTGLGPMPAGEALSRFAAALTERPTDADWLEMADTRRGVLRAAIVSDGALEACLFLARDPTLLPAEQAVIPMLGAPVPDSARANILSGRMYGATANEGPKVCACFGVTRVAIRHAVATENLTTVKQIGELLRAGTNCGSCIPELQEILRDVRILAE